jgi:molybdopterin-guanine dinucleotide biosynthesis protein B
VSAKRWAVVNELAGAAEPTLEEAAAWLGPCDLIIVEGYKSAPIPKIEVRRSAAVSHVRLADEDSNVCAIAADHPITERRLPVFALDDIVRIADFIAATAGVIAAKPDKPIP